MQGGFKNEMLGLTFDPLIAGNPKLTGEYVLTNMYGLSLDHSKWLDLLALHLLIVIYRIVFFLVLKLKETRALSSIRSHCSMRNLYHPNRRHYEEAPQTIQ